MIITLSGDPGSGKSTIAKAIAKALHLKHHSTGDMRGLLAQEKGITIDELNRQGETDPYSDKIVDERIARMGEEEDDFVIDSRLAWHFIPESIKVYLACDLATAAERILNDKTSSKRHRTDEPDYADAADVERHLKARVASDKKRFGQYYGIDSTDKRHYDLVVDTTHLPLQKVIDTVLAFIKNRRASS